MKNKTKNTPMVKALRYELRVVLLVRVDDPDVAEFIDQAREIGSCDVVNVSVVEVNQDQL